MQSIHVVGDSISIHYGPYLEQFLTGLFTYSRKEGMPGQPDEPNGANGGDSSLVLRYLYACRDRGYHWNVLLVNCGLHDVKTDPHVGVRQVEPEEYRRNVQAIVGAGRLLADRLIWVRTTPVIDAVHNSRSQAFHRFAADVDAYNGIADAVMRGNGIATIDLFVFTRNLGDGIVVDHVHYGEDARGLQAAFIAGSLLTTIRDNRD
jgi:hypothetical protein